MISKLISTWSLSNSSNHLPELVNHCPTLQKIKLFSKKERHSLTITTFLSTKMKFLFIKSKMCFDNLWSLKLCPNNLNRIGNGLKKILLQISINGVMKFEKRSKDKKKFRSSLQSKNWCLKLFQDNQKDTQQVKLQYWHQRINKFKNHPWQAWRKSWRKLTNFNHYFL